MSTETTPATPAAYEVAATLDNRTYTNNARSPAHHHRLRQLGQPRRLGTTRPRRPAGRHHRPVDRHLGTAGRGEPHLPGEQHHGQPLRPGLGLQLRPAPRPLQPGQRRDRLLRRLRRQAPLRVLDRHRLDARPAAFSASCRQAARTGRSPTRAASIDTFTTSGTTALWSSETDRNGNATTYAWNSGNLTITAANGQQINVTCNASGQVTKATYATTAGTREIDYQTASPWQVTYYPGSAVQRYVTYTYNSSRCSPPSTSSTGQARATPQARPSSTAGSDLTEVDFPDYNATTKPDARADDRLQQPASAKIDHYGTVGGARNVKTKEETDSWSTQTGATAAEETQVETSANSTESSTTQFNYAANDQLADSVTLATNSSNQTTQDVSACNASGDITAQSTTRASASTRWPTPTRPTPTCPPLSPTHWARRPTPTTRTATCLHPAHAELKRRRLPAHRTPITPRASSRKRSS